MTQFVSDTHSPFNNCGVLIVYQVTIYNRHSKFPPSESLTRLTMDHHPLWKVAKRLPIVWQVSKTCLWSVSSFSIGTEYTRGFLVTPHIKIWRTEVNTLLGCTSKAKCLRTYIHMNLFSLFWCGELTPDVCWSILDALCINVLICKL